MKRWMSVLLIALSLFVFLPLNTAWAFDLSMGDNALFIFPASLEEIGEEAFAGTGVRSVMLDRRVIRIKTGAFDQTSNLNSVFIPSSVEYIGVQAFGTAEGIVIHGVPCSYAEDWTRQNNLPFVPDYVWRWFYFNARPGGPVIRPTETRESDLIDTDSLIRPMGRSDNDPISERPQDRPELNPIDYRFP